MIFFRETNSFTNISLDLEKNHYTPQAFIEVLDNICQHCDNQELTTGLYLGLQKPFDTVNHSILV